MNEKDEPPTGESPESVVLRVCPLQRIIALRHAELRPGLPRDQAEFPADHDPRTRHYAAFEQSPADEPVGCASCMPSEWPSEWRGEPAYQLRGMAVRADRTGRGIGRALLRFAERDIRDTMGVRLLWCNARLTAVPFYERHGWRTASDVFDVPGVGPHRRMVRRLDEADP